MRQPKRITDKSVWDSFISPGTLAALAALALIPLLIPAVLMWAVFAVVLRWFDKD